jgi:hypothetical protein
MATPSATAGLYESLPLRRGAKCVCILNVRPLSTTNLDEPIQADLDQDPPFTALSYVWGTKSSQLKTVTIGTTTVEVTDNNL